MGKNHLMAMAEFIHSHPEHQMQPSRIWRTHYEDECKEENKAYSFSALKQYPILVKIRKTGRNNCYGSAKLPSNIVGNTAAVNKFDRTVTAIENKTRSKDAASNKFPNNTVATATTNKPTQASKTNANQQLNLRLTPELALERTLRVMQRASAEIESIVRQLKSIDTSKTD